MINVGAKVKFRSFIKGKVYAHKVQNEKADVHTSYLYAYILSFDS